MSNDLICFFFTSVSKVFLFPPCTPVVMLPLSVVICTVKFLTYGVTSHEGPLHTMPCCSAVWYSLEVFMFSGIPIIKIIFGGYDGLSVISIPLLVYHPVQILLGGLLVPTVKAWLITTERFRYTAIDLMKIQAKTVMCLKIKLLKIIAIVAMLRMPFLAPLYGRSRLADVWCGSVHQESINTCLLVHSPSF